MPRAAVLFCHFSRRSEPETLDQKTMDGSDQLQWGDPWAEWFCVRIGSEQVPFKMVFFVKKLPNICWKIGSKHFNKILDHMLCTKN